MILDEATSALDNRNEKGVEISLDRVSRNVMTVVIAHRLTTIINADTIIAMRRGEIVEMGSHQELWDKGGYYSTLFKSQIFDEKEKPENNDEVANEYKATNNNNNLEDKTDLLKKGFDAECLEIKLVPSKHIAELLKVVDENQEAQRKKKEQQERISKSKHKLLSFLSQDKGSIVLATLGASVNGAIFPIYGLLLAMSIESLSMPDLNKVSEEGFFLSMMYLIIAGCAGLAVFYQNYLFSNVGDILCRNLRSAVFKKYLQLHIGFFDKGENAPGALIARLSSDTTK